MVEQKELQALVSNIHGGNFLVEELGAKSDYNAMLETQLSEFNTTKHAVLKKLRQLQNELPANNSSTLSPQAIESIQKTVGQLLSIMSREDMKWDPQKNNSILQNNIKFLLQAKTILTYFNNLLSGHELTTVERADLDALFNELFSKISDLPGTEDSLLHHISIDLTQFAAALLVMTAYMLQFILVSNGAFAVVSIFSVAAIVMLSLAVCIFFHNKKTGQAAFFDAFAERLSTVFSENDTLYQFLNNKAAVAAAKRSNHVTFDGVVDSLGGSYIKVPGLEGSYVRVANPVGSRIPDIVGESDDSVSVHSDLSSASSGLYWFNASNAFFSDPVRGYHDESSASTTHSRLEGIAEETEVNPLAESYDYLSYSTSSNTDNSALLDDVDNGSVFRSMAKK